jgi:hypothetical protein
VFSGKLKRVRSILSRIQDSEIIWEIVKTEDEADVRADALVVRDAIKILDEAEVQPCETITQVRIINEIVVK